jgi:hypothetical protein
VADVVEEDPLGRVRRVDVRVDLDVDDVDAAVALDELAAFLNTKTKQRAEEDLVEAAVADDGGVRVLRRRALRLA